MKKPTIPMQGGCLCGKVRFRIEALPVLTGACHCTGCQHMSGSAFSLTAIFPADSFEVTAGEPVVGALHGPTQHLFCDWCKSWMFTRPAGLKWLVNVRATLLDDPSWFEPYMETYTAEALPWAKTSAVESFAKYPEANAYQDLMKGFSETLK